jgi:hypothetical protein
MRTVARYTALALFLVAACTSGAGVPKGFFEMPPQERQALFPSYDFETQFKTYLYGMNTEPPATELASALASEGRQVVPQLKQKLETTDDDGTISDILLVFRNMQDMGNYDVAGDRALMTELQTKVDGIKSPVLRQICQTRITQITTSARETH